MITEKEFKLKKEKILVLSPILSLWNKEANSVFEKQFTFLSPYFEIEFKDCLEFLSAEDIYNEELFYSKWEKYFRKNIDQYKYLAGFSFGGCILSQIFPLINLFQKKVLMFSVPSFANSDLNKKLSNVIELIQEYKVENAFIEKERLVLYPNIPEKKKYLIEEKYEKEAAMRVKAGLTLLLKTDSREKINSAPVNYLNFIGEKSLLVNKENVLKNNNLVIVPNSGMRVLDDNFEFCKNKIFEFLGVTHD